MPRGRGRGGRYAVAKRGRKSRPNRVRTVTEPPAASTSFVTSVSIASGPTAQKIDRDSWMNRPYTAHSPYSLTPTERIHSPREDSDETVVLGSEKEYGTVEDYENYEDYEDYDAYDDDPIDRRWIWIAGVAGAILLVAVICTVVILGGGDSGSVSATVAAPATTSARASTSAPPAPSTPSAPPPAALPPETVTTLTPTES